MKKIIIYLVLFVSVSINVVLVFKINHMHDIEDKDQILVLKEFHNMTFSDKEKTEIVSSNSIVNDNNYLFLGDSITFRYDLNKYYNNLPVVNSGVDGDKTCDIMKNIKKRVYDYNPSKIFLLIGTNQLKTQDDEEIFEDIVNLDVESIYPVNGNIVNRHTKIRKNSRIRNINNMLQDYYKDSYVKYVDLYSELADDEGNLKKEYSDDALHLNDEGYKIVTNVLKKYL